MTAATIDQQLARRATRVLRLYDLARRGLLPMTKLETMVDPRVLAALGPITPPTAGAPITPPRIGGLRVQRTSDRHAHVAAVAHNPSGGAVGYILELRRDGAARPWLVTELSRVEERALVGPDPEDPIDRRTRRLPDNLTGLISATQHARDQAAEQLRDAEQAHTAIRDKPRRRQRQRAEVSRARRDVTRLRQRVRDIDTELRELHDTAALREIRAAVLAGDPLTSPRISQLQILLGAPPDGPRARDSWRRIAQRLLDYAAEWDVANLLVDMPLEGGNDTDPRTHP